MLLPARLMLSRTDILGNTDSCWQVRADAEPVDWEARMPDTSRPLT